MYDESIRSALAVTEEMVLRANPCRPAAQYLIYECDPRPSEEAFPNNCSYR